MSEDPPINHHRSSDSDQTERYSLRVPPVFGFRFYVSIVTAVGLVAILNANSLLAQDGLVRLLLLTTFVTFLSGVFATSGRRRLPMSIEVLPDRVHIPFADTTLLAVRFRHIHGLFVHRQPLSGFVFIATEDRDFVFPLHLFRSGDPERLVESIRRRIVEEAADGHRRLDMLDHQAHRCGFAFARLPVVTWAVVAVLVSIHVYLVTTGCLVGVLDVASLGAVSPELVDAAGPYLALTANWVHHTWQLQPLLVIPGVFILGSLVERLLGHGTAALSILGSSLVGGLMAAYYPGSPMHAGAVIPVAGLIGTLAFTAQRYHRRMPMGFRLNRQWWMWLILLSLIVLSIHGFSLVGAIWGLVSDYRLSVYGISIPGVLFGLLTGAGVAAMVTDRDPELPLVHSPRWISAVSLVLLSLHVGAGAWALEDLKGRGLAFERIVVAHMHNPEVLSRYAMGIALSTEEVVNDREQLAVEAAERAVGLETRASARREYRSVLAATLFRVGRHEEAIQLQQRVLEVEPRNLFYASQFAKFLVDIPDEDPEVAAALLKPIEGISAELDVASSVLTLTVPHSLDKPYILYGSVWAVAEEEETKLVGLLRFPVLPTTTTSTMAVDVVRPSMKLPDEVNIRPSFVVPGKASSKLWMYISDAFRLP
ncbi:MAG: tetratricopeptide repeat protein [Myxococcales bacterium]|nr:tetratricopeptide repeat protein [Myxococcales bacterium]